MASQRPWRRGMGWQVRTLTPSGKHDDVSVMEVRALPAARPGHGAAPASEHRRRWSGGGGGGGGACRWLLHPCLPRGSFSRTQPLDHRCCAPQVPAHDPARRSSMTTLKVSLAESKR